MLGFSYRGLAAPPRAPTGFWDRPSPEWVGSARDIEAAKRDAKSLTAADVEPMVRAL